MSARILISLAVLFTLAPTGHAGDGDKEPAKIHGRWKAVAIFDKDGKRLVAKDSEFAKEMLEDNPVIVFGAKKGILKSDRSADQEFIYNLDVTQKLKTIDLVLEQKRKKGEPQKFAEDEPALGIYELQGDTLKIALVRKRIGTQVERPTKFSATWKADDTAFELKRENAKEK